MAMICTTTKPISIIRIYGVALVGKNLEKYTNLLSSRLLELLYSIRILRII